MDEKLIVGEMDFPDGEMDHLQAKLTSIKPEDIPLADGVDMEMMKSYDDDPLEVVVEIPASVSTRRWKYTKKAIEDIVKATNERTLSISIYRRILQFKETSWFIRTHES